MTNIILLSICSTLIACRLAYVLVALHFSAKKQLYPEINRVAFKSQAVVFSIILAGLSFTIGLLIGLA